MDDPRIRWHYPNMSHSAPIPAFSLYGEARGFPDVLHCERIRDRARLHDWRIAPHRHSNLHQAVLIRQGSAWLSVDGRVREMAVPVLLNIPPWVVHGFRFEAGTEGYVLTLPSDTLPEVLGEEALLAPLLSAWGAVCAEPALDALFEGLLQEQDRQDAARGPMLRALATQVLCHAARGLSGSVTGAAPARFTAYMQSLDAILQSSIGAGLRLPDYAAALGLTSTHLNRVTRALAGMSAGRYIEARRMREAQRMLAYTRLPVAEIGYALGYDDPAYFSRAFRRQTGETPSACRQRLTGTELPPPPADAGA